MVPFVLALVVTLALARGLLRWAPRLGLLDAPTARKPHARAVPVGGPALALGVLAGWGASAPWTREWALAGWLLGALVVAVVGLVDDRRALPPTTKLLGHVVAALIPVASGHVVRGVALGDLVVPLGPLAAPLTLLWVVGVTNALNLADGLDGLACGLALVVALASAALSAQTGHADALTLAWALAGAALGFLALNAPPARLFLGDSGSYFLGFLLAGLTLTAPTPPSGPGLDPDLDLDGVPLLVPLALLGYPLADTLWAIARRLKAGRSIFEPDDQHLHHELRRALGDESKAVWALWGLTMLLAALALSAAGSRRP